MSAATKPANPYRLFDFYRYEDREFFHGRTFETQKVVGEILSTRLLVLFAPSGSGKSSLLNAGVRPALEDLGYRVLSARVMPGLADSVLPALREALPGLPQEISLTDALKLACPSRPPRPARPADGPAATEESSAAAPRPIVMILDQFEEFFIRVEDRRVRREFIKQLADLVFSPDVRIHFILSLRSDYFVCLNEFREAIPSIFQNNANVELLPFHIGAAMDAIVNPARKQGVEYTPELICELFGDLEALRLEEPDPGQFEEPRILPIHLQTVCHRLWELLPAGERTITLELYEEAGRAKAIVEHRVLDPLRRIPAARKPLLRHLLSLLITVDKTKRQLSREHLLAEVGPRNAAAVDQLIESLTADLLLIETTTDAHPGTAAVRGCELRGVLAPAIGPGGETPPELAGGDACGTGGKVGTRPRESTADAHRWIELRHDFLAARLDPWVTREKGTARRRQTHRRAGFRRSGALHRGLDHGGLD